MNPPNVQVQGPEKKKHKQSLIDLKIKKNLKDIKAIKDKAPKKKKLFIVLGLILIVLIGSRTAGIIFDKIGVALTGASKNNQDIAAGEDSQKDGASRETGSSDVIGEETVDLKNLSGDRFIEILKSGNYVITYKTAAVYEGETFEVETIYAVSGDNIVMASGDRATIVRDGKVYLLNYTEKSIIRWEVNPEKGSPKRIDTEGIVYLGSSMEGGLACEEYKTETSDIKIYFKENELVKMVARVNKEEIVMNIMEIKKPAPENLFEVPSGYSATNI